ncbi:MAG: thiamine-phosphate kinase [Candidatus Acidiferrales bacterium]
MSETKRLLAKGQGFGESAILERVKRTAYVTGIRKLGLRLGIGDDAALIKVTSGYDAILTCDWFLEGTHFLRDKHPADAVGWKCLARAVSDVAAMGGVPSCFLLSLALPTTHTGAWLDQFLSGLRRASRRFACVLAGGDTTRKREILINVTVVGEVREGKALLRSQARPGDVLFTSGRLGEAELGLELIRGSEGRVNSRDPVLKKHLYPEPRLALGRWLSEKGLASAMMDLSDGLSADLPRLCEASDVGARIEAAKIPAVRLSKIRQKRGDHALRLALHGGDDYELLFTVARKHVTRIPPSFHGLPITPIGEITKDPALLLIDETRRETPLPNRGWDPFRKPR